MNSRIIRYEELQKKQDLRGQNRHALKHGERDEEERVKGIAF